MFTPGRIQRPLENLLPVPAASISPAPYLSNFQDLMGLTGCCATGWLSRLRDAISLPAIAGR